MKGANTSTNTVPRPSAAEGCHFCASLSGRLTPFSHKKQLTRSLLSPPSQLVQYYKNYTASQILGVLKEADKAMLPAV